MNGYSAQEDRLAIEQDFSSTRLEGCETQSNLRLHPGLLVYQPCIALALLATSVQGREQKRANHGASIVFNCGGCLCSQFRNFNFHLVSAMRAFHMNPSLEGWNLLRGLDGDRIGR